MNEKSFKNVKVGSVVQLSPQHKFSAMLVVVTKVYGWGIQGYLLSPFDFAAIKIGGLAFLRVLTEEFEYVGHIVYKIDHLKLIEDNGKNLDIPMEYVVANNFF